MKIKNNFFNILIFIIIIWFLNLSCKKESKNSNIIKKERKYDVVEELNRQYLNTKINKELGLYTNELEYIADFDINNKLSKELKNKEKIRKEIKNNKKEEKIDYSRFDDKEFAKKLENIKKNQIDKREKKNELYFISQDKYNIANYYYEKNDIDLAIKNLESSLYYDENNKEAILLFGKILAKKESDRAEFYLQKALDLYENKKEILEILTLFYENRGEIEKAIKVYKNIIDNELFFLDYHLRYAELLLKNRQFKEAYDILKVCYEYNSNNIKVLKNLVLISEILKYNNDNNFYQKKLRLLYESENGI